MVTEAHKRTVAINGSWGVFRNESSRWLGTRGLLHLVFWLLLIDGWLYHTVVTESMPFGGLGFESLIGMLAVFPILAAVILAEAMIIGEHHDGITAWTVSKPVPRSGYVIGKLAALWAALSAIAIFIPGLLAYWWLPKVQPYRFVIPKAPPLGRFIAALLLLSLAVAFFVALTGFLGTLIRRRGMVALIALLVWVPMRVPLLVPWDDWYRFTPSGLIGAELNQWLPVVQYVYGDPLIATSAVLWTMVATVAFIAGTALIYQRLEL